MKEYPAPNNDSVPVETLLKWQSREVMRLRREIARKNKTISRLRNNIRLILNDPKLKYEIACEAKVREYAYNMSKAQQELHRVRKSEEKIIQTLLTYKLKELDDLRRTKETC